MNQKPNIQKAGTENTRSKKSNFKLKIFLVLLAASLIAYFCVSYFIVRKYKALVIKKLPAWVAKASDSLYIAEVENIGISMINRRVVFKNIRFYVDTVKLKSLIRKGEAPGVVVDAKIPKIKITGILWENVWLDKAIDVNKFSVIDPDIKLTILPSADSTLLREKMNNVTLRNINIPGSSTINKLSAKAIELKDPKVLIQKWRPSIQDSRLISTGGYVALNNWNYEPGQAKDTSKLYYAESATVLISGIRYYQPGSDYGFAVDTLNFDPSNFKCELNGFTMACVYNKSEFYRRKNVQKDLYRIEVPSILFNPLHWQEFLYKDRLLADKIIVKKPVIEIFKNKNYPPEEGSKLDNYPTNLIASSQIKFLIKQAILEDAEVTYNELDPKTQRVGEVIFTQINGSIQNITNQKKLQDLNDTVLIIAEGKFMNRAPVQTVFKFSLSDSLGAFDGKMTMQDLNADYIQHLGSNLGLLSFKSVDVSELAQSIRGNFDSCLVQSTIRYQNLKLDILKVDTNSGQLYSRPFLSYLANTIVIYPSNPLPKLPVRSVDFTMNYKPMKSFTNNIWRSIYRSVIMTVIREEDLLNAIKNRTSRKQIRMDKKEVRKEKRRIRKERRETRRAEREQVNH